MRKAILTEAQPFKNTYGVEMSISAVGTHLAACNSGLGGTRNERNMIELVT